MILSPAQLEAKLNLAIAQVRPDFLPVMDKLNEYLNDRTIENFAKRQTPEGEAWEPSAHPELYEADLILSGALFASATTVGLAGAAARSLVKTMGHPASGDVVPGIQFFGLLKNRKTKRKPKKKTWKTLRLIKRIVRAIKAVTQTNVTNVFRAVKPLLGRRRNRPRPRIGVRVRRRDEWRIPPRRYLGITPQDAAVMSEIVARTTAEQVANQVAGGLRAG